MFDRVVEIAFHFIHDPEFIADERPVDTRNLDRLVQQLFLFIEFVDCGKRDRQVAIHRRILGCKALYNGGIVLPICCNPGTGFHRSSPGDL